MKKFQPGIKPFISAVLFYALLLTAGQTAFSQYMCQPNGPTEVRTGSIAAGDATQTSRVFRDGTASSCTGGVPTAAPVAGSFRFDQYSFTNPTGLPACVTVDLDATGYGGTANNSTQINAYSPTFDPANVMTNLVGKPGFSTIGRARSPFRLRRARASSSPFTKSSRAAAAPVTPSA
ncbi:MAG TPA: hypothetical protein VGC97_17245 [Pyrinomonadaceae bacterium]|jgi:hypothetical protein